MHLKFISLLLCLLILQSCGFSLQDPQEIVDRAIEKAGGERFENLQMEFDLRDRQYKVTRNNGRFSYERIFRDSTYTIHDFLTNDGFSRKINGQSHAVPDSMAVRYSRSVNSVVYFALLPFGLNDTAVNKRLLGEIVLAGESYYKVEVTFDEEGGGEDFEDVFVYWIHQQDFTVDYMGYSFQVNGGGTRFRKAYNVRNIDGIKVADYINYKPKQPNSAVQVHDSMFLRQELEELSRIELKNIRVNLLSGGS